MVHDDGTIDGAIPAPRGPVFVVGHLATPGWLAVLAGPLLGSRGVLENMSGWNAAGKLLDPSLLGSSGSTTITRLHASFASQVDNAAPTHPILRRCSSAIGSGGVGVTPPLPAHVRGGALSTA